MKELLLAEYSLKLRPLHGPFHRDFLNLPWLLEAIRSTLRSGFLLLQREDGLDFVPVISGVIKGEMPGNFEMISFYSTLENFVMDAFKLEEKRQIPLYSEKPIWVNLESIKFNLREFFRKLLDFEVTGYMVVENRVRLIKALLLLHKGQIMRVEYEGMYGINALKRLLDDMKREVCVIRVYEMPEDLLSLLLLDMEYSKTYENYEVPNAVDAGGVTLIVSVTPERYGYIAYAGGSEVFRNGFEEAPFYELFTSTLATPSAEPIDVFSLLAEGGNMRVMKYNPEHPIIYFCPACWSIISKDDSVCPNCGYDLKEFHNLPYEYKLIMALEHPMKDMRKNVIYTIGRKSLELALPHIELMISRETDPLVLMEIADALSRMSSPEATRLLRQLALHRYAVVRSRALMHLQRKLGDV